MRKTIVIPVPVGDEASEALDTLETLETVKNPFSYDQLCKLMGIRPLPPEDPRDRTR